MRILIAVHTYYPDKNGVQAVTQYIAEGLAKTHEVLVVTELEESRTTAEKKNNVKIERIKIHKKGYKFKGEKKKFFKIIDNYVPDVLISVCTQSWPFDWLWEIIDQLQCKKILYTHGYSGLQKHYPIGYDITHLKLRAFRYHLHWMLYYHNAYKYIKKYDLVTYLSPNNNSFWYAQKYGLQNGAILSNAVEDIFFQRSSLDRIEEGKTDNITRYIYVANFDNNKNQKSILRAFLKAALKNAELIFIGSSANEYYTELLQEYEEKGKRTESGRVLFLTGLQRQETAEQLRLSDVFVCGSRHEQYPLMLCEAAAKGLPIISTNVGHAAEMDGCIVVENMEEMTDKMKFLYERPEERLKRGKLLREYALEHYQIRDKVAWLEKKISEL